MSFKKPSIALGLGRKGTGDLNHTDTNEFLSPGVLIAFRERPGEVYPTAQMKLKINAAAIQARNIVRLANDIMAKVVIMRRPESQLFQDTMATHFGLIAGDLAGGLLKDNIVDKPFSAKAVFQLDRRWVLEQIRQKMLSLSFHLNTGVYIIDQDTSKRDVFDGTQQTVGFAPYDQWAGYVHMRGKQTGVKGLTCGFRNGEIHASFDLMDTFSLNTNACIIIHEACHKYVGAGDLAAGGVDIYANDVAYPPPLQKKNGALNNADCIAWTAISLATGAVRMDNQGSNDWTDCPGVAL